MKISTIKTRKILLIIFFIIIVFFIFVKIIQKSPGLKGSLIDEIIILTKQPYLINHVYNSNDVDKKYLLTGIIKSIYQKLIYTSNYKTLYIDMPFDNYLKIKSDRKLALNKNQTSQYLSKKTKVKADIRFDNKKIKSKIRLKGDRADHWGRNKRFSFYVELLDGNTIFKFRNFSISNHKSRSFPQNEVISNSANRVGLITPKFQTVKVVFNGDDWGLMYVEEQFSSNFFEDRKIKQIPIARFTDQENDRIISELSNERYSNEYFGDLLNLQGNRFIKIYNKKKYKKKLNSNNFISFYRSFNLLTKDLGLTEIEEKNLLKFYNKKKFATLLAYNSLFNDWHSTNHANIRYYFNPYLGKIEPIPTDFLGANYWNNFSKIQNIEYVKEKLKGLDKIFVNLFDDKDFKKFFYQALSKIKNDLPYMSKDLEALCINYSNECYKGINFDNLLHNYHFLKKNKNLFKDLKQKILIDKKKFNYSNIINSKYSEKQAIKAFTKIKKKIYYRIFSDGEIYFENITPVEIFVDEIRLNTKNDKINLEYECIKNINIKIKLKPGDKFRHNLKKYNYNNLCLKDVSQLEMIIKTDLNTESYMIDVENAFLNKKNIFSDVSIDYINYLNNLQFIKKVDNDYIFDIGSHIIRKPLIIPKGHNLVIKDGTEIFFNENSFIYINEGNLISLGDKNKINKFKALKDHWGGILVSNSSKSKIIHTSFENMDYYSDVFANIYLTGSINFFNSNINLNGVNFKNSIAEDMLNIVNSNFFLNDVVFEKSISDALDVDFSNGKITNFNFFSINGDAIDTSGSVANIENGLIDQIYDKAISVGENSKLDVKKIKISNSLIGLAVKDNSLLSANEVIFDNNINDISLYLKKPFYEKGGTAMINNYIPNDITIQKDEFSKLILNKTEFKKINFSYEN